MRPGHSNPRAAPRLAGVAVLLLHGVAVHAAVREVDTLPAFAQLGSIIEASPPERRTQLQELQQLLDRGDDAAGLQYVRSLAQGQPAVAADLHETLAGMYLRERRLYRSSQHLEAIPDRHRSDQARYLEANIAARQQRLAAALGLLEGLARRSPDDPLVARDEAQVASLLGRHAQSAAACDRLLRQRPNDSEATLLLARMRVQQGQLDEAARLLSSVLAREPRNGRAALQLGLVQLASNKPQAARASFARARTLEPGNAAPHAAEAAVALLVGDTVGARRAAAAARVQNAADPLAGLVELLSQPEAAQPPAPGSARFAAAGLYPDLDTEPLPSRLRTEMAAAGRAGRIAVASLLSEQLAPRAALVVLGSDSDADRWPLTELTATRALVAAGDLQAAAARLAALEGDAAARGLAGPAVQAAVLAARRNDPVAARAAMARAVTRAPESPRVRMLAGDLLLVLGDPAQAVPEYRAALERWPRDPRLLNQLAHALAAAGSAQEREQALALVGTALRQQPHYLLRAALLDTRADLLFRLGRSGEALTAYRELSTTVGGMTAPEQWHRLGDLAQAAGEAALARRAYEEALDLGRDYPGRATAVQRVDGASGTGARK